MAMVQSPSDSMELVVVNSSSPVAMDKDEESVGSEVMVTIHESSDFKGVHHS